MLVCNISASSQASKAPEGLAQLWFVSKSYCWWFWAPTCSQQIRHFHLLNTRKTMIPWWFHYDVICYSPPVITSAILGGKSLQWHSMTASFPTCVPFAMPCTFWAVRKLRPNHRGSRSNVNDVNDANVLPVVFVRTAGTALIILIPVKVS